MPRITLAGWLAAEPDDWAEELPAVLITTNATTIAITASTLPPAIRPRWRISARRAAACCAAIFSLALCRRFRSALPMTVLFLAPGELLPAQRHAPEVSSSFPPGDCPAVAPRARPGRVRPRRRP